MTTTMWFSVTHASLHRDVNKNEDECNHVCLNVSNLTGEAQGVTTARKKQMIAALFTKL